MGKPKEAGGATPSSEAPPPADTRAVSDIERAIDRLDGMLDKVIRFGALWLAGRIGAPPNGFNAVDTDRLIDRARFLESFAQAGASGSANDLPASEAPAGLTHQANTPNG